MKKEIAIVADNGFRPAVVRVVYSLFFIVSVFSYFISYGDAGISAFSSYRKIGVSTADVFTMKISLGALFVFIYIHLLRVYVTIEEIETPFSIIHEKFSLHNSGYIFYLADKLIRILIFTAITFKAVTNFDAMINIDSMVYDGSGVNIDEALLVNRTHVSAEHLFRAQFEIIIVYFSIIYLLLTTWNLMFLLSKKTRSALPKRFYISEFFVFIALFFMSVIYAPDQEHINPNALFYIPFLLVYNVKDYVSIDGGHSAVIMSIVVLVIVALLLTTLTYKDKDYKVEDLSVSSEGFFGNIFIYLNNTAKKSLRYYLVRSILIFFGHIMAVILPGFYFGEKYNVNNIFVCKQAIDHNACALDKVYHGAKCKQESCVLEPFKDGKRDASHGVP